MFFVVDLVLFAKACLTHPDVSSQSGLVGGCNKRRVAHTNYWREGDSETQRLTDTHGKKK